MADDRNSGVPDEPRIFRPGDTFRGRQYVIEAFLGAGVSGQVYAVRHQFTGDRFALKVGHLTDRRDAKKVARSLVEALATYRIRHHNVVHVFDLACEDDGMVWQLMELYEGKAVGELLKRYGRFSPLYAVDIATEVAWGLRAAHEQQVIHRNVQPANIFVTTSGVVKVLDFSMAKVITSGLQTAAGMGSMGTMPYMAPEQLSGAPSTPQFDVYALGLVLWQMLAGRHPFEDSFRDLQRLVIRQKTENTPSLTSVGLPAYVDEVLQTATAKRPEHRFAGMWPMARALVDLRERLATDRTIAHLVHAVPTWERQHPIVRDPSGSSKYMGPKSLPLEAAPPEAPSARVVVPVQVEGQPRQSSPPSSRPPSALAATMEMTGVMAMPLGPSASSAATLKSFPAQGSRPRTELKATMRDLSPPTARGPARPSRLAIGLIALAVPLLFGFGAALAVILGPKPAESPVTRSSTTTVEQAPDATPIAVPGSDAAPPLNGSAVPSPPR